jgi:hypothetical protein
MLEKSIRDLIESYLAFEIDQSHFAQEFAGFYFRVRNERTASLNTRQLCNSVVLPFAELSRGHRSEESFREVLTGIVRPFAKFGASSRIVRIAIGVPRFTATSTNPSVPWEVSVA